MVSLTRHSFSVPVLGLLALILVVSGVIFGVSTVRSEEQRSSVPAVAVFPAVAELHSSTALVLLGSGFEPGEEISLLLGDSLGVLTDLGASSALLDPPAVPDESGNFATKFQVGRLERVSAEQAWSIIILDAEGSAVLTTAPFAFCDPQGRSRAGLYPRGAPDYEKNPDDIRPAPHCQGQAAFEYPEKPE